MKRLFPILTVLLALVLILPLSTAAQTIESNHTTRLDILYEYGNTPVSSAQIHIYKVGNVSSSGGVSLSAPYASYPLDHSLILEDTQQAAKLLYHYILLNRTSPDAIVVTDAEGQAQKELGVGLYLIIPQRRSDYRGIFRSEPALISLPYRASAEDPWAYQVSYMPKCAFTPQSRVGTMQLYVTKKWEAVSEDDQPEEVTVYLLRDNTIFQQVKLNAENRWLYKWEDLSEYYDWRVVEKPISGYTVTMSGNIGSVLLTNTAEDEIPEETEPDETTETTESTESTQATEQTKPKETQPDCNKDKPSKPSNPSKPSGSSSGGGSKKLPQTGMLWWPVPLLLFLGIGLVFLGVRIRRGADYEE